MTYHDPRASCLGKVPYPSPQAAHAFIERICKRKPTRRNRAFFEKATPLEVYHCPICHEYHHRSVQ